MKVQTTHTQPPYMYIVLSTTSFTLRGIDLALRARLGLVSLTDITSWSIATQNLLLSFHIYQGQKSSYSTVTRNAVIVH